MNLTITCACGTGGTIRSAEAGHSWRCPDCGSAWRADQRSAARFTEFAAAVRRMRMVVLFALLLAAVAAGVLAVVDPGRLLLVPVLLGVAAILYRPTHRRRLTRLYQQLPQAVAERQRS
ncbi:hypothetical protein [Streptacidiphilus sp. EB103A]|uniref:hypothetical protein n=1 Tax=Streptacidiphilus sp. EB103A TaxID=3156275 RepID=UPI00351410F8